MSQRFATGGCDCGGVRYARRSAPIVAPCRPCARRRRETGSAFALHAKIGTRRPDVPGAVPDRVLTPSASGGGRKIARRPSRRVAAWSHCATLDAKPAFVRVGTRDDPSRIAPDVHIVTSMKLPWVILPAGAEVYSGFDSAADRVRMFGPERMARREALIEEAKRLSC